MRIKKQALSVLVAVMLGMAMLVALPSQVYANPPEFTAELQQNQSRVLLRFSEGVFGDTAGSTPILATDFNLSFSQGSGTGTATDITSHYIRNSFNGNLTGGESLIYIYFTLNGTVTGGEQIVITPVGGMIYNATGEALATTTSGTLSFGAPVSTYICEIVGGAQYTTLDDALKAYSTGQTITLLQNITEATDVIVYDLLTINLNGHNLQLDGCDIYVGTTGDLTITGGGSVTVDTTIDIDGGKLTVNADIVSGNGGVVAHTGTQASITGNINLPAGGVGIWAGGNNTSVTLTGSITVASGHNLSVVESARVIVNGDLINNGDGSVVYSEAIYAGYGAHVEVNGNITCASQGIEVHGDSEVLINGNITSGNGEAIQVWEATVIVDGNVSMVNAEHEKCVYVILQSTVTISGDVTTDGYFNQGVYAFGDDDAEAKITIGGNVCVSGRDSLAVVAERNCKISIAGNVTNSGDYCGGIYAYAGDGSTSVNVTGSVDVSGLQSIAVDANTNSCITIEGDVTAAGLRCGGIIAYSYNGETHVNVGSDVSVFGDYSIAIEAEALGNIVVQGDVVAEGERAWGATANNGGVLTVGGNVITKGINTIGVDAYIASIVDVGGNIVATGDDSIGVQVQYGSEVTIEGTITAPIYISFGELEIDGINYDPYTKTAADNDSTSNKADYLQYSESYSIDNDPDTLLTDFVWVKNSDFTDPDTPDPDPDIPDPDPGTTDPGTTDPGTTGLDINRQGNTGSGTINPGISGSGTKLPRTADSIGLLAGAAALLTALAAAFVFSLRRWVNQA
jgi:hypothetical protein